MNRVRTAMDNTLKAVDDRFLSHLLGSLRQVAHLLQGGDAGSGFADVWAALSSAVPMDALAVLAIDPDSLDVDFVLGPEGPGSKSCNLPPLPAKTLRDRFANGSAFQVDAGSRGSAIPENGSAHLLLAPLAASDGLPRFLQASRQAPRFDSIDLEVVAISAGMLAMKFVPPEDAGAQASPALREAQRENQKLLSIVDLARSIAHELNQPLTGISGYCALIQEALESCDPIYHDVAEIQKQALRLEDLIVKFQNVAHVDFRAQQHKGA